MDKLHIVDYLVVVLALLVSAIIGIYYNFSGGKQRTLKEYVLADRSMSPWPVAFSLMASFISAVTLLGVPSENYSYGTQYVAMNISYLIATPIFCYVFLPVFYNRGGCASAYEYLEQRFGKLTRTMASMAFTLQMVLYNGIVLLGPSLALSAVTGLDKLTAVLSVGFVCTFYSTIGGIKAVLLTDVFQSMLMFAAIYIVIVSGIINLGFTEVFRRANQGGRIQLFNFDLDPTVRHTVWTQAIGGTFHYLSILANQAQVQRLLTVRNLKTSGQSLWFCLPILCIMSIGSTWAGLTIYAEYKDCDPISDKRITKSDQLLPLYVVEKLGEYPGLTGLFAVGILSGSLSTLSSSINSLAAVTLEDYIKPFCRTSFSPQRTTIVIKLLALAYGLLAILLSFVADHMKGILQASLTVFGVVGGPLLGLFTLGMVFPFTSQKSSVPSFVISLIVGLWIGFGGPKPPINKLAMSTELCESNTNSNTTSSFYGPTNSTWAATFNTKPLQEEHYFFLYRLSYMWLTLIGFSITIILSCFGSLAFPETKKLDPSLFSPLINRVHKVKNWPDDPESEIKLEAVGLAVSQTEEVQE